MYSVTKGVWKKQTIWSCGLSRLRSWILEKIRNMIFRKWGGGSKPFGTFPKIHQFWWGQASLTIKWTMHGKMFSGSASQNLNIPACGRFPGHQCNQAKPPLMIPICGTIFPRIYTSKALRVHSDMCCCIFVYAFMLQICTICSVLVCLIGTFVCLLRALSCPKLLWGALIILQ